MMGRKEIGPREIRRENVVLGPIQLGNLERQPSPIDFCSNPPTPPRTTLGILLPTASSIAPPPSAFSTLEPFPADKSRTSGCRHISAVDQS